MSSTEIEQYTWVTLKLNRTTCFVHMERWENPYDLLITIVGWFHAFMHSWLTVWRIPLIMNWTSAHFNNQAWNNHCHHQQQETHEYSSGATQDKDGWNGTEGMNQCSIYEHTYLATVHIIHCNEWIVIHGAKTYGLIVMHIYRWMDKK